MNVGSVQYSQTAYQPTGARGTQQQDFESIMEQKRAELEKAVESGAIDTDELQEKLQAQFGDAVNEAFGEDGSVDFEKLDEIIQSQMGQVGQGMPPGGMPGMSGPPPGGPPPDGGQLDPEEMQAKLTSIFGEDAEGIVSEDGEIDSERLQELIEENKNSDFERGYRSPFSSNSMDSGSSFMMRAVFR